MGYQTIHCPQCRKDDIVQKISAIVEGETHHTIGQSSTYGSISIEGSSNHYAESGEYYGKSKLSGNASNTSRTNHQATQRSKIAQKLSPPEEPQCPNDLPTYEQFAQNYKSNDDNEAGGLLMISALGFIPAAIIATISGNLWALALSPVIGFIVVMIIGVMANNGILKTTPKFLDEFGWGKIPKEYEKLVQMHKKQTKNYESRIQQWNKEINNWQKTFYCRRCDLVYIPGETDSVSPSDLRKIL